MRGKHHLVFSCHEECYLPLLYLSLSRCKALIPYEMCVGLVTSPPGMAEIEYTGTDSAATITSGGSVGDLMYPTDADLETSGGFYER